MSITVATDSELDPQILEDTVQGHFAGLNVIQGSILSTNGAVMVSGTMPEGGPDAIGRSVEVPYFGVIGDFASNPDGSSITPSKLLQGKETATVTRDSLAFEISRWSRGQAAVKSNQLDPYVEAARQIELSAGRLLDKAIVTEAATSPLLLDISSSTTDFLNYEAVVRAQTKFRDEQDDIVAMAIHSQTLADLARLKDADGRPLLTTQPEGQRGIRRFNGIPLLVSDRVPVSGTVGSVTSAGTTPPVATVTVDASESAYLGPWDLRIECTLLGAHATATIRFSVDGGQTWSESLTTAGVGVALPLIDTAKDSTVGYNGRTGLEVAFASGTFAVNNTWSATVNLTVESMIFQRGAAAHWYNAQAMRLLTDEDILADTQIGAMHLYHAPHLYRRRRGGSLPGVVRIKHKVLDYRGN